MKKSLFIFAAAALALTACTSEDDVVQSAAQKQASADALAFDVYLPQTSQVTRSGRVNVMDNTTLQTAGFGVFGYQTDGLYTAGTSLPNYMWNQQVNYNATNIGWYYTPLKYWPNETGHDSQSTSAGMPEAPSGLNVDRLTFFAYAPWVKGTPATGAVASVYTDIEATTSFGITQLTANTGKLGSAAVADPKIRYVVATDPSQSVDLLWGVAPVGDLSYTNVAGTTTKVDAGAPLIDLLKPAVNTNMKFLFQHALARLGVKVVLAADQVLAGGNFDVANTKVTIEEIAIKGNFGSEGTLNLNNKTKALNTAYWEDITKADEDGTAFKINSTNGLAKHLVYDATKNTSDTHKQQVVTGVTTTYSDAIQVSNKATYSKQVTTPAYSATTPYFADNDDHVGATPNYAAYSGGWTKTDYAVYLQKNQNGGYTDITKKINTTYPTATVWKDIYGLSAAAKIVAITVDNKSSKSGEVAYRKYESGDVAEVDIYMPTGVAPEVGDYIFEETPAAVTLTPTGNYYLANSNYFMIIPPAAQETADKTLTVKITYYVSTTDPNVANGVVYTKNVVEKAIELPHLKNGYAYNLKLILGMTSVKLEAEVADWQTAGAEINLPQNTAE
jgi:hypothetical protein